MSVYTVKVELPKNAEQFMEKLWNDIGEDIQKICGNRDLNFRQKMMLVQDMVIGMEDFEHMCTECSPTIEGEPDTRIVAEGAILIICLIAVGYALCH